MATRASRLSIFHVNALNSIDLEFYGNNKKLKKVIEALKIYLTHLYNKHLLEESPESWRSKGDDLFVDLLQKMALSLEYDFDKDSIQKTSYYPEGYGQKEEDELIIRKGLAKLFKGEFAIPMQVSLGELDDKQEKLTDLQIKFFSNYDPNSTYKVKIVEDHRE